MVQGLPGDTEKLWVRHQNASPFFPPHPRVTLGKSPDLSGPSFAHCDLTRLTSVAFWDTSSTEGAPESHMWSAKPIPT